MKILSRLSAIPLVIGWRAPLLLEENKFSTADVCEKVLPGVFRIVSSNSANSQTVGSGFFIKNDGTGLTAAHVLENGSSFQAILESGEYFPLSVLNTHKNSDVALIKVKVPYPVPALVLGDSDKNRRGEQVIHFGNTIFGSTTEIDVGYINKTRDDTPKWVEIQMNENMASSKSGIKYIMTSGSVRPGFSGGPLVNMKGEVIGLICRLYFRNQQHFTEHEGASIPINFVSGLIKQLEKQGEVIRPYIGLSFTPHNPGVAVVKVQPGSPAEKAGIKIGDILTSVNGKKITTPEDIFSEIGYNIGITLKLIVIRKNSEFQLTINT